MGPALLRSCCRRFLGSISPHIDRYRLRPAEIAVAHSALWADPQQSFYVISKEGPQNCRSNDDSKNNAETDQ